MKNSADKTWFTRELRTALTSLYDPYVLRNSPLANLFGVDQQRQPIFALRRMLTEAIETLRPGSDTPTDSKSWRVYQILRRRYTEQMSQRELAADLFLSIRQLQREEKRAREVLADHLWAVHDLETKTQAFSTTSPPEKTNDRVDSTENRLSNRAQELEWLRNSVSPQMADVEDVIQAVLKTIAPLLASSGVSVTHAPQEHLPQLFTKISLLRQALINLLTIAVHYAPGGEISIWTEVLSDYLTVDIQALTAPPPRHTSPFGQKDAQPEGLRMAEQLIRLCRGSLNAKLNAEERDVFTATIRLPITEQAVLVIDDNTDTRRLFQRYLTGTRYRFIEAATAQHGLTLAEELIPQFIVLDVMMPEQDGWTVLGQLREHPLTHHIPVIVCSIMSQKDLSQALGAADFLRKPVSRSALLSALDRQVDSI